MVIREILDFMDDMCQSYNSEELDFARWHTFPFFLLEDSGCEPVGDPVVFERVFETLLNFKQYLDLPRVDYLLVHFHEVSDNIVTIKVVWEFFSDQQEVELILEIGHIVQKQESGWKIIALIQPTWREPKRDGTGVKMSRTNEGGGD